MRAPWPFCQYAALAVLGLLLWAAPAAARPESGDGPAPAAPGRILPDIVLDQPERECGLLLVCAPGRELRLSGLPGRWLLVETFSMYCPHCQAEACKVNDLAGLLAAGSASGAPGGLTLVGLGAGNSRYEVDYFQKHYAVPFALFPDQDMAFYDALGAPGTPSFALVEKTGDGLVLRALHVGPFAQPGALLDELFGRPAAAGEGRP
ncbi:MAG: peroxiredoxin family protein [Desulfovibrionaceae bacterium]